MVSTLKGFAFVALTALLLAVWWRAEQRHNAVMLENAEARASFASERMAWMSRHGKQPHPFVCVQTPSPLPADGAALTADFWIYSP